MREKIYVVSEYYGRGGEGREHFSINREYVQRSFELYETQGEEKWDNFNTEIEEEGYDYDKSSATLVSGTIGAYVDDDEMFQKNKEAFLSKEKGWCVECEEHNYAFGATKEQALLAFAEIDLDDEWD